jgi:septal ring factor EnvC (AmiA/AmiB activator)
MNNRLEDRLAELQKEYEAGQKMLADLDAKRQSLSSTLLRIEGAMQVLREMLADDGANGRASRDEPPAPIQP